MADVKETAYNQIAEKKMAQITTSERSWINKLLKYAEEHPDETNIRAHPDDNNGILLIDVPKTWFKIRPNKKRELSEEQRAIMAERLKKSRENSDK